MATDKKNDFEIYGLETIEGLLMQGKLLLPEELDSIIRKNTDLPFGERYLIFFKSNLYLVQLMDIAGKPERFTILTATGEIPNRSIVDGIIKSDTMLKLLRPMDFVILNKVVASLLDTKPKSLQELSIEIIETKNDVEFSLKELKEMQLLDEKRLTTNLFSINFHIQAFNKIAKIMLNSKYRYDFMSSNYIQAATRRGFPITYRKKI
jgi:hypothetical protein